MSATKAPCKACGGAFSAHSSPRRECPTGGTFLTQTTRDGSYARCTNCKTYQDSHETADDGRKLCPDGSGRELVFTLGTGFGIALVVEGALVRIRDVGAEVFLDGKTYDQSVGERARSLDEHRWGEVLVKAVSGFAQEFSATSVHLAGGNARRVVPTLFADLPFDVVIDGNQASLRGAAKLFYP